MWAKSLFATALLVTTMAGPAFAQSALDSTAATGQMGGWSNGSTNGNFFGGAGSTGKQGDKLGLQPTSSSSPMKGGGNAPGNLALKQMGKNSLPPTKLTGFVNRAPQSFDDEGKNGPPPENSFTDGFRIERAMDSMPDLTTKHRIGGPSAWDFPN